LPYVPWNTYVYSEPRQGSGKNIHKINGSFQMNNFGVLNFPRNVIKQEPWAYLMKFN